MGRFTVLASELASRANIEPMQLATRPSGERFRKLLKAELTRLGQDSVLVLDFKGIQAMDTSFPDEVFGTLAIERARRKYTGACLLLSGLNQSFREGIDIVLMSWPKRMRGVGNCVLPVISQSGSVELIGPHEEHVKQTFELLRKKKELTARDLVADLHLAIGAASTRLKAVYDMGLAIRSPLPNTRGKEYVYRLPT